METAYFIAFSVSAALSYGLAPVFIRLAYLWHLLDIPSDRKRHRKPMPYLGGVVLFFSFWSSVTVGFLLVHLSDTKIYQFLNLPPFFQNILNWTPQIAGVFTGSLVVLILGLLDDRLNLSPVIKFIGQSGAALALLHIGLQVNLFQDFGGFGYVITYVWIVLLMNAFNFIDSIDGHCIGIALISSFIFFLITQIVEQSAVALLILTFTGALFGFFPYNFKPARIFLGDNGSLFIGYIMSVITLLCRYNVAGGSEVTPFIPVLMFGVPIYDTVSVVVVRVIRGIRPWTGDRNHLAHRLVRLGMGERTAALASYFIATTLGLIALLSTQISTELGNLLLVALFACIISIIALFEYYAALRIRLAEKLARHKHRRREDIQAAEDRL